MDRTVTVIQHDTDRCGRMVADILLPDGRMLNKELVRSGNAWWYSQYDRNDAELQTLEAHAREARPGLWPHPNPLPPWEWRKLDMATPKPKQARSWRSQSRSERPF